MQAFCYLSGKSFIDMGLSNRIHNDRQRLIERAIHNGKTNVRKVSIRRKIYFV
jgi:hypothetical protein